jgi:mediator of RNA polymerase II transcription subunit 31
MMVEQHPSPNSARFTLELEFVLCLSHPNYLQYLANAHRHLLIEPTTQAGVPKDPDSEAACFARYLAYLYKYWCTPEYSQYLTYPVATLRNLELLQNKQFREDLIKPEVIEKLGQTLRIEEGSQGQFMQEAPVAEPVGMDTAPE